ncbi:MAG: hypothetical protein WAK40_04405 [Thermoplasmata archaeon]
MAEVVRSGAHIPRWESGGHRVPGPDEDPFTFAATAVERAARGATRPGAPIRIELLGEVGPIGSWGFSALLGADVVLRAHPPSGEEFASTLEALRRADGPALLVAVDLGEGSGNAVAGSVAYLLDGPAAGSSQAPRPIPPGDPTETAVAAARRWFIQQTPAVRGTAAVVGTTEDGGSPTLTRPLDGTPRRPSSAVSEGAFVPYPRYLEGLPSRWRFHGERCGACGRIGFPIRGRCNRCGRTDRLEPMPLPLDGGTVVATTWIGTGGQPTEFDPQVESTGSYGVAIVELAPGVRATLQLTDCRRHEIKIGSQVGTQLRRLYSLEGEWRYGRKAVPLRSVSSGVR